MGFHSIQLKTQTFEMLPIAVMEYLDHHPEWESEKISNNKIIFEALRYYIGTGKYKKDLGGEK